MRGTIGRAARTLGMLLALASSLAAAQSQGICRYLDSAATFYEDLDYEHALAQLDRAKAQTTGPEDDAAIALYEGVVLSDMGKEEQALAAFKASLMEVPDAKLPLEVSPKVEALFQRARTAVRKALGPRGLKDKEAERKAAEERRQAEAKQAEARLAEPKPVEAKPAETNPSETAQAEAKQIEAPALLSEKPAGEPTRQPAPVQTVPRSTGAEDEVIAIHDTGSPPNPRTVAWIPALGGVLCGAGAGYLYYQATVNYGLLNTGTAPPAMARQIYEDGKQQQQLSFIIGGIGAAALLTAGVLYVAGSEPARPDVFVGLDRGVITVGVRTP